MTKPGDVDISTAYRWRLHRNFLIYILILLSLMGALAWAEL